MIATGKVWVSRFWTSTKSLTSAPLYGDRRPALLNKSYLYTHCCGREWARVRACVRYLPVMYRPPPGHEGHKVVGFPTVRHASYLILMRSRVQFHSRPLPLTFALFVNSAKRMEFLHEMLVVSESKQVSHLQKCGGTRFRDTSKPLKNIIYSKAS